MSRGLAAGPPLAQLGERHRLQARSGARHRHQVHLMALFIHLRHKEWALVAFNPHTLAQTGRTRK